MDAKIIWLAVFVVLYWTYCILMGFKGARQARTASDYMVAGRRLTLWVFVLAATATSFSGWTFMGHPGLVFRDGFQYAYASFYAITIPFTGVLFLKRQWMIGKRFGYVTPGEMMSTYFGGEYIRWLTVLVALLFSVPYLGVQLGASGFLFNVLTDGALSREFGMWMLSIVVLIYVASGGLRAVAYVDTVQCIMIAAGIIVLGGIALYYMDGLAMLAASLGVMGENPELSGQWGPTPDGHSAYLAVPGVIQFTAGLGVESPVGGLWTGVMILTYMFALMGIQSSPAFSMWAFSNTDPRPFRVQQVWASSFGIGLILFVFTAFQGMGAHFLGANPEMTEAGLEHASIVSAEVAEPGNEDSLVPFLMHTLGETAPWLMALLAVCALGAMQSTGAAYMSTAGSMLTRDLYKRYLRPGALHFEQKLVGRLCVVAIVVAALVVATVSRDALVLLGGLAVAFGFQMWPALAAVCWFPWITRQGVGWGLTMGLLGVVFTESFGLEILALAGVELWGRWPLTIHSAGWGIVLNVTTVLIVSALTQNRESYRHRLTYHNFLHEHAGLGAKKRRWVPLAWIITIGWFFFAIGPGVVIGNTIFGDPGDSATWIFGIPSIWAWQILWWALGVGMMWFLAYFMEMSTVPKKEIEVLVEDIGDESSEGGSPEDSSVGSPK